MKTIHKLLIFFFLILIFLPLNNVSAVERTEKVVTVTPGSTSTEIQALLDYNKEDAYLLTVKIPAGSYTLLKELRIYSNTTILADPAAKMLKYHEKGALLANDLSSDLGGYTTTENISIIGGIWDSEKVAYAVKGTESFRFIHATNVTVKDATICNVPESSHLITFAGVKGGTVENCVIYGYKGTEPKEAIQIDIVHDNIVVPSMQADILHYDDLACDGITIKNNEIYDYPRAIGSHTSVKGVFHKNITITGNNLHNLAEAAIKAYNYKNVTISSNTISNASVGILLYTAIDNEQEHYKDALPGVPFENLPDSYNISIEANIIKDMKLYKSGTTYIWGDGIRVIGSKTRPIPGLSIKKNKITNTGRFGIFITYAPKSYIGSNTIVNTSRHSLYLEYSDTSKIYYNKIYTAGKAGSTDGGIGLSNSKNNVIYKNYVKNAAKNGIFLYNSSTGCNISTNTVVAAKDNAIAVNLSSNNARIYSNTITGNTIAGSNNRGIFVYGANYASISYNVITRCKVKQEINTYNSVGSKLYKNTIHQ